MSCRLWKKNFPHIPSLQCPASLTTQLCLGDPEKDEATDKQEDDDDDREDSAEMSDVIEDEAKIQDDKDCMTNRPQYG